MIPIYITNRDLLSPIRGMIQYLTKIPEAQPIIIDCASTYPPTLEWYNKDCPVPVKLLTENKGPRASWYFRDSDPEYFVISDGDFDLSAIPFDCLDVLRNGLIKYPDHLKAGFRMRVDDLPETPIKQAILGEQSRFDKIKLDDLFYEGEIDCAFALHRKSYQPYHYGELGPLGHFGPSILTSDPYVMRHLSWYVTPENLTEEWEYFLAHASTEGVVWTKIIKKWLEI